MKTLLEIEKIMYVNTKYLAHNGVTQIKQKEGQLMLYGKACLMYYHNFNMLRVDKCENVQNTNTLVINAPNAVAFLQSTLILESFFISIKSLQTNTS